MSEAFDRGRNTEREVAKLLRKKLNVQVQRDKRSGAGTNKADIQDYYGELPIFIECKDQETLKVKEWMRQTIAGASFNQTPTLVFRMDTDLMACLPFSNLVNFLMEIAELQAENADLRQPIVQVQSTPKGSNPFNQLIEPVVAKKVKGGEKTCRAGHIADQWGYCMQLDCKFSRGYRAPKQK